MKPQPWWTHDCDPMTVDSVIAQLAATAAIDELMLPALGRDTVECRALIGDLAGALRRTMPPTSRVSIAVEADEVWLLAAVARLLGMLVHELVLNAIRHAFGPLGGHIVIRLSQSGSFACCAVRDHGLGLCGVDPLARGYGMSRAQLLAQRTGASCSWHVHHDGTEAIIIADAGLPASGAVRLV